MSEGAAHGAVPRRARGGEPPALPPLKAVIARFGLRARKSLGQNFLLDPRLTAKIAAAAGPLRGKRVVEIGPGPGGLTRALLAADCAQLFAVEKDRRCLAALAELAAAFPGRLELIEADALLFDVAALAPPLVKLVANLPYNIATPLLLKWLGTPEAFEDLILMFQKEVAQRLAAAPGGRAYGRLSVMTQWRFRVERLFDLPPGAFLPPPKVTSTLVRLTPRGSPLAPAVREDLERVVAAAFGQRRKMLRGALKSLVPEPEALLAAAGIEPSARAEALDVAAFCALARAYAAQRARSA